MDQVPQRALVQPWPVPAPGPDWLNDRSLATIIPPVIETGESRTRALLVTAFTESTERTEDWKVRRVEAEARSLLDTLGIDCPGSVSFNLKTVSAATHLGSGQVEQTREHALFFNADMVYFDFALTARAARNLEAVLGLPVMDRNELIIEIFASRAKSREARLQVQLARCQFLLPRLRSANVVYSQQRGGVRGAKGEGERQIELDRRRLSEEVVKLRREIGKVKSRRVTQRRRRLDGTAPSFALVGYTNSGKSSLLSALTGCETLCEDKLFATLDTLERTVTLTGLQVILCDTVGFVSNLPHFLIDAFSSTLEEARLADALVLVLDGSSPDLMDNYTTTMSVLRDLDALDKPVIVAFNKCDMPCADEIALAGIRSRHDMTVRVSAKTGENLAGLCSMIRSTALSLTGCRTVRLKVSDSAAIQELYAGKKVISADYTDDDVVFTIAGE